LTKLSYGIIRPAPETSQILISQFEHFHQQNDLMAMLAQSNKGAVTQRPKHAKQVRIGTIQHVHKVFRELERGRFKACILARRRQKKEPKIDVNQVTPVVKQDVTVVAILDLKQKANHGIRSKALTKVGFGI
jgi:hypothetical protein